MVCTTTSTVLQTEVDNFEKVERKMQEKETTILKKKGDGGSGRDAVESNQSSKMHSSSAQIDSEPAHSCIASSSHAFFSFLSCLSPLRCSGGGSRDAKDPRSIRLDQFWADMHLQAEAMRQSSPEVMSYMKEVFSGKKAEPPEIVQTAMAAAVRLGQQSYGDTTCSSSCSDSTSNKPISRSSGGGGSGGGGGEQVVVGMPSSSGASGATSSFTIEKDRIKVGFQTLFKFLNFFIIYY
jgi:hypothetical protein